MRPKLIATFIGVMAAGSVYADDLISVYREAVVQDPVYSAQRAAYQATKERRVQARSLLLPNINATGNAGYNSLDTNFSGGNAAQVSAFEGSRNYESYGAGVNITQPLFRRQNNVTYEQSGLQVTQAESQVALAGQDLMVRVAQAYFDVLTSEYDLVTVEAQKAAIAEQLAQAKRNFEVGTATITDTYDAQARYDLIVAQELATRNDIEVRRRALQQLTGRNPGPLNTLEVPVSLNPPAPNDMEKWVQAAYATNPQVRTAKAALDIANKEVDRNRFGHYPTVDAVGSLNYQSQGGSNFGNNIGQDVRSAAIGLQLAVPLYSGGAISSRVREAIANRTRAEQDLENARRSVAQATRQAFLAVNTGLSQINALQQAVNSNKLSVEASKLGQEVGVRTEVDVLNAQQLLYEAQRDLARAYYNAIVSQLRLKANVGRLTEADLENVNRLLAPPKR
ncbi:MAG TPA: TolC family outer membrane protein [Burkholderiales bacterium]|nr:TolC family outer membrane protein [Burkholderiales bacterium]